MQEVNAGGTIRLNVPKLAELQPNKSVVSPSYSIANLPWTLQVMQEVQANVKYLTVYANGNTSNKDSNWKCEAELTRTFDGPHRGWGSPTFMKWDDVLNPEKGFLREDGGIVVEATITVKKVFVTQTACDFSTPQPSISEVALVIGEQHLYVSKDYLAAFSPVFKAMFFGNFDEKNKDEIPLEDVDHDEFVFIYIANNNKKAGPLWKINNVGILIRIN